MRGAWRTGALACGGAGMRRQDETGDADGTLLWSTSARAMISDNVEGGNLPTILQRSVPQLPLSIS